MTQESKVECYRKAYQDLKQMRGVRNLGYPDEKKDLEFFCDIGNFHVTYNLRLSIDFITIRAGKIFKNKTDEELNEIGMALSEGQSFSYTGYDNKLFLQLSLPMAGIADEDAKKRIDDETQNFFRFLIEEEGVSVESIAEYQSDEPEEEEVEESAGVFTEPDQERSDISESDQKTASGIKDERRRAELEWIAKIRQENADKSEDLKMKEERVILLQSEIDQRSKSLDEKEKNLQDQEQSVAVQREELNKKELEINSLKREVDEKTTELTNREEKCRQRQEELDQRAADIEKTKRELDDSLNEFTSKKTEFEQEQNGLKSLQDQVQEQLAAVSQKEQLLEEKMKIQEDREQLLKEKEESLAKKEDALNQARNSLDQRETEINQLLDSIDEQQSQLEKDKADVEERINLEEQLKRKEEELREKEELERRLRVRLTQKSEEQEKDQIIIANLQIELDEYKKQAENYGTPDELLKDFSDTRKENRKLKRDILDLEMEMQANEKALIDKIKELQEAQAAKEQEKKNNEVEMLPENIAEKIIQELRGSGLTLHAETIDNRICLRGTKEGCRILFDVNHMVIHIEKDVRKAYRFADEISKWNHNDITESYIIEKNRVICRKFITLTEITMDVNKVIRRLLVLK